MSISLFPVGLRACLLLASFLGGVCAAAALPDTALQPDLVEQGRLIYVEGRLASGAALQATRNSGAALSGRDAACTNCHRASGMGSVEGQARVPPISQRYLFGQADDLVMANVDGRRGKTLNRGLSGYTEATLGHLLQDGISPAGRQVSDVMPHFTLQPSELQALRSYLQQLSSEYSPGVGKDVIRFATVITPEVSEARRSVFKSMLQSALASKNSSTAPRKRHMAAAASFATQTERHWDVQVWELSGSADTWGAQLKAHYAATPVFALLSGLSDSNWAPVDAFCRSQALPCWFPSVALATAGDAQYGLYFSRGVALEADVLASYLADAAPVRQMVQVVSADNAAARAAATELRQAWLPKGHALQDVALSADPAQALVSLRKALQATHAGDAVALWLSPAQWPLLEMLTPPQGVQFYASSTLGQDAAWSTVPAAWQPVLHGIYPYQLPQERAANLAYLHAWLKLRNIPLVDEVLQSELFFSLNLMTDTLQDMLDNLYRDYLMERTEDMLGKRESAKAWQESRDRQTLGRLGRVAVKSESLSGTAVPDALNAEGAQRRAFGVGISEGTTIYPHLTLGPGQRYASRGAYIVRLAPGPAHTLEAISDWIVP